ncbi:hypothetical protein [Candidatus Uabimicrobium sp. HlEnr_7]|uniref:hypothetical protein n=1 Tax=Candidatus Uabimicrobium helgolandensis TaxID=3095367 RepID=UPI0035586AF2
MKKLLNNKQKKLYYKCPCCLDTEKNFYVQKTKNPERMHCFCPDCKLTIFSPTKKMDETLEFIEYWQKNGNGIVIKSRYEKGKFKAIGGKIACPCCKSKQTTMLQRIDKKGFFQLNCHWRAECGFSIFVQFGYLYLITKYSENKKND